MWHIGGLLDRDPAVGSVVGKLVGSFVGAKVGFVVLSKTGLLATVGRRVGRWVGDTAEVG